MTDKTEIDELIGDLRLLEKATSPFVKTSPTVKAIENKLLQLKAMQERVEDSESIAEFIFPYVGDIGSDYYAKEEREYCLKATKAIQKYIKGA